MLSAETETLRATSVAMKVVEIVGSFMFADTLWNLEKDNVSFWRFDLVRVNICYREGRVRTLYLYVSIGPNTAPLSRHLQTMILSPQSQHFGPQAKVRLCTQNGRDWHHD